MNVMIYQFLEQLRRGCLLKYKLLSSSILKASEEHDNKWLEQCKVWTTNIHPSLFLYYSTYFSFSDSFLLSLFSSLFEFHSLKFPLHVYSSHPHELNIFSNIPCLYRIYWIFKVQCNLQSSFCFSSCLFSNTYFIKVFSRRHSSISEKLTLANLLNSKCLFPYLS